MDAAIAALVGAVIGIGGSLVTVVVQQKYQNKRELLKIASDLAMQDYRRRMELMTEAGGKMPPVSAFVHYHVQVLEHMANGTFTPEAVERLNEENARILAAYKRLSVGRVEADAT